MTELLGKSVGEWSSNKNSNFGGTFGSPSTRTPISKECLERIKQMDFDSNTDKLEYLRNCTKENPVIKDTKTLEEKKQEVIRKLTKTTPNTTSNSTSTESANSDSNTKYYIYGGIGLVVILGAFLIFKK
jgi:hypothetical protein